MVYRFAYTTAPLTPVTHAPNNSIATGTGAYHPEVARYRLAALLVRTTESLQGLQKPWPVTWHQSRTFYFAPNPYISQVPAAYLHAEQGHEMRDDDL
jgi:hypothetical protein